MSIEATTFLKKINAQTEYKDILNQMQSSFQVCRSDRREDDADAHDLQRLTRTIEHLEAVAAATSKLPITVAHDIGRLVNDVCALSLTQICSP
jgi:hypothetical protein